MKMMRKFGESNNNDEVISNLKDIIDFFYSEKEFKKMHNIQNKLQNKFGITYDPASLKSEITPTLHTIYKKEDFHFYEDWISYCDKLFQLRFNTYKRFITEKYAYKIVSLNDIRSILEQNGIRVKEIEDSRDTMLAYVGGVVGTTITFNNAHPEFSHAERIPIEILVHELGHIFENQYSLHFKDTYAHSRAYMSSEYDLSPSEIFAENFQHYFLEPVFLQTGWVEVYDELEKLIPEEWKELISLLLQI